MQDQQLDTPTLSEATQTITRSLEKQRRDWSPLYVPGSIIIAGILIGGGLFLGLSHSSTTTAANAAAPQVSVDIKDVKTDGDPFIGNADAPVVIAFWADYQCPYCKAVEVGDSRISTPAALPDIVKQYVQTGKVKIVFKDFEFLGDDSIADGEYARAIWHLYPDKFYAWRTAMFTEQPQENSLSAEENKAHVEKVTASISGIDVSAVEADIAKNKAAYDAAMTADMQEGQSFSITGTPAFIIGKTLIPGAQAFSGFQTIIDPLLK